MRWVFTRGSRHRPSSALTATSSLFEQTLPFICKPIMIAQPPVNGLQGLFLPPSVCEAWEADWSAGRVPEDEGGTACFRFLEEMVVAKVVASARRRLGGVSTLHRWSTNSGGQLSTASNPLGFPKRGTHHQDCLGSAEWLLSSCGSSAPHTACRLPGYHPSWPSSAQTCCSKMAPVAIAGALPCGSVLRCAASQNHQRD